MSIESESNRSLGRVISDLLIFSNILPSFLDYFLLDQIEMLRWEYSSHRWRWGTEDSIFSPGNQQDHFIFENRSMKKSGEE